MLNRYSSTQTLMFPFGFFFPLFLGGVEGCRDMIHVFTYITYTNSEKKVIVHGNMSSKSINRGLNTNLYESYIFN